MKKAISLILAICLVAAVAVCASAAKPVVVVHDQTPWETQNSVEHNFCGVWTQLGVESGALVRLTADYVKVLNITDETEQTWTKCDEALTIAEGKAICEANGYTNLTVFRQRNVKNDNGPIDLSVKLWPCNPELHDNQAVVVLFRAEGTEGWTVAGFNNETNECTVQIGNGAYVVAMVW